MTDKDNRKAALEALFDQVIEQLTAKIASGEATAADIQAARQLLRDNGIDINKNAPPAGVKRLIDALPELDPEDLPAPYPKFN